MFACANMPLGRHRLKKLDRRGEEVITTMGLDERLVAGSLVLSLAISDTCGQDSVLLLLRALDKLTHDTILSWVVTTSVLVLVIGEGIQVNPALEKESVSRYESLK